MRPVLRNIGHILFVSVVVISAIISSRLEAASLVCESLFDSSPAEPIIGDLVTFAESYGIKFDPARLSGGAIPPQMLRPDYPLQGFTQFSGGFIEAQAKNSTEDSRVVVTSPVATPNLMAIPSFTGEIWTDGEKHFRYFNPAKVALQERQILDQAEDMAKEVAAKNPDAQIRIPLDPKWMKARHAVFDRQIWTTARGVRNYEGKKSYLSGEDRLELRMGDLMNPNENDLHVLLRDTGKSPWVMTPEEYENAIAIMLRVARHIPSQYQNMVLHGIRADLPHIQRTRNAIRETLRRFFEQMGNARLRIAELSRFNRLKSVSPAVMDAFILNMFESTAQSNPVDIFVLECDDATGKLFSSRYKFTELTKISAEDEDSEYLMYLDVRSEAYREVTDRLRKSAGPIARATDAFVPPIETWTSGWRYPKDFWSFYGRLKQDMMDRQIRSDRRYVRPAVGGVVRKQVIRDMAMKSWKQPVATLRLSKAEQNQRVAEFIRWTSVYQQIAGALTANIDSEDRVLILGSSGSVLPGVFASELKRQYPKRAIDTKLKDVIYDKVVVVGALSSQTSAQRDLILKAAFRHLSTEGKIVILDRIKETYPKSAKSDLKMWQDLAESALKNGLSLSKEDWFRSLLALRESLFPDETILSQGALSEALDRAGFETSSWSGTDFDLPLSYRMQIYSR